MLQKNIYSVPFLASQHGEFVLWFFTGSKCNLTCTHCYVESSPTAKKHPLLTIETVKSKLIEVASKNYNKIDIYFTGGEPFINPQIIKMLEASLKYGDTTILTNATKISKTISLKLLDLQNKSKYKLIFRVSIDGPNKESNDLIRGKNAFTRATKGINNLVKNGFNPIVTTMRSWSLLEDIKIKEQFVELMINQGIPREEQLLKILPQLKLGREIKRDRGYSIDELFTKDCFNNYDFNNLQCSKCRIVSERGVWVCPILINEDHARMGNTILDAEKSYDMIDMACWTCRMEGMSCTND